MNTNKHTPGPWIAKRVRDSETNGDLDIDSVDGYHIAESIGGLDDGEEEANARLIAAAPDLLHACAAIVEWCDKNPPAGDALYCINQARAAIAKVEGQS